MIRSRKLKYLAAFLPVLLCAPDSGVAGSIRGTVVLGSRALPQKKLAVTIDQYVCGTEKDAGDLLLSPQNELRNAVVWLENPPPNAAWPAEAKKVEVDQKGCVFVPRVVVVPAGGTVDFLNSDRLLHNVHAAPKLNNSFNRTQPKSRTVPIAFTKPEIVRVTCELHSWMTAWVVVAAHPFYAVTGPDGQFTFNDLPPGVYKLQVWHERLGMVPASVTVGRQGQASVKIEMQAR